MDLYCADPSQPLTKAGEKLDDLDNGLSIDALDHDLSVGMHPVHPCKSFMFEVYPKSFCVPGTYIDDGIAAVLLYYGIYYTSIASLRVGDGLDV